MDDPGAPRLLAAGAARPAKRLRQRPGRVAPGGVDDDAGRLVDDEQILVLVGDRRTGPTWLGRHRAAARHRPRSARRPRPTWRLRRSTAVDPHQLGVDQASGRCARDPSGSARNRSSRVPAACRDLELDRAPRHARAATLRPRRPSSTHTQDEHAERDRHVGDVERRPVRQLDEVGDRAVGDPVDQVADRAADQHPGGQPQPRPGRAGARSSPSSTASATEREDAAPARRRRRRSRTPRPCCGRGRGCTPGSNLLRLARGDPAAIVCLVSWSSTTTTTSHDRRPARTRDRAAARCRSPERPSTVARSAGDRVDHDGPHEVQDDDRDHRAQVEHPDRRDEPAEDPQVGLADVAQEVQ